MPDLPAEIPREWLQPLIDILQASQGNDELMVKLGQIKDEWLGCNDLPADHPLFSMNKKKIPGKFKNETSEEHIQWMVALRAKMYSYETRTKQAKICKGTAKGVVEREITLEDYRATQLGPPPCAPRASEESKAFETPGSLGESSIMRQCPGSPAYVSVGRRRRGRGGRPALRAAAPSQRGLSSLRLGFQFH